MSEAIKLSSKLWLRKSETQKYYLIWCPACKCGHGIPTGGSTKDVDRWQFDGNVGFPTFSPSVRLTAPPSDYQCHFNVTAGKLVYHGDCNHELKGRIIDMQDIPSDYGF